MIEIIKPGTKEKTICKECGCYFSYEHEDIESTIYNVTYCRTHKIIRCPQCECVIVLDVEK